MEDKIEQWKELTDKIVERFIFDYFDDDAPNWDWVQRGGVFNYNDLWFDFQLILECYRLEVTHKQLMNWYDSSLEQQHDLSLEDFLKSPEKRKQQEEKYLQELKDRLKTAKEILKKAMEEYGK